MEWSFSLFVRFVRFTLLIYRCRLFPAYRWDRVGFADPIADEGIFVGRMVSEGDRLDQFTGGGP